MRALRAPPYLNAGIKRDQATHRSCPGIRQFLSLNNVDRRGAVDLMSTNVDMLWNATAGHRDQQDKVLLRSNHLSNVRLVVSSDRSCSQATDGGDP